MLDIDAIEATVAAEQKAGNLITEIYVEDLAALLRIARAVRDWRAGDIDSDEMLDIADEWFTTLSTPEAR